MNPLSLHPRADERRIPAGNFIRPVYLDLGDGRLLAKFGKQPGDGLEVVRSRERAYPGLVGPAPRTDAIYKAFAPLVADRKVLDVGCGSAYGSSLLAGAAAVTGIDKSEVAVRFAARAVPDYLFLRLDATRERLPESNAAVIVDLLGSVTSPEAVLRNVGAALGEGGLLCIAEPRATSAQELAAPMVRAFSKGELTQLLRDCGFEADEWLCEGGFYALTARRVSTAWTRGLEAAEQLIQCGLGDEALELLLNPPRHASGALVGSWALRAADLAMQRSEGDQALQIVMDAHQECPSDARLLSYLARVSLSLGQADDARRFAAAAVEREGTSAPALAAYVEASSVEGGDGEQLLLWSNAARLDPSNVDVAVRVARAAAEIGAYYVGISVLERVREYHRSLPADFHLTLGWLYLMAGRTEDSLLECRIAGVLEPGHPGIADLIAAVCEAEPSPLGRA
jgi:SAM-dependent methyltransferase